MGLGYSYLSPPPSPPHSLPLSPSHNSLDHSEENSDLLLSDFLAKRLEVSAEPSHDKSGRVGEKENTRQQGEERKRVKRKLGHSNRFDGGVRTDPRSPSLSLTRSPNVRLLKPNSPSPSSPSPSLPSSSSSSSSSSIPNDPRSPGVAFKRTPLALCEEKEKEEREKKREDETLTQLSGMSLVGYLSLSLSSCPSSPYSTPTLPKDEETGGRGEREAKWREREEEYLVPLEQDREIELVFSDLSYEEEEERGEREEREEEEKRMKMKEEVGEVGGEEEEEEGEEEEEEEREKLEEEGGVESEEGDQ